MNPNGQSWMQKRCSFAARALIDSFRAKYDMHWSQPRFTQCTGQGCYMGICWLCTCGAGACGTCAISQDSMGIQVSGFPSCNSLQCFSLIILAVEHGFGVHAPFSWTSGKISPASCCIGTCGKSGTSATVPNIWARQYIAKKNLVEWGSRVLYAIRIQICVCHTQRLISICCMSEHRFNQHVEFHFFLLGNPGIVIQPLKRNCKVTFLNKPWALVRKYLRLSPEELSASMMTAAQFLEGCHPYTCAASVWYVLGSSGAKRKYLIFICLPMTWNDEEYWSLRKHDCENGILKWNFSTTPPLKFRF